MRLSLIYRLGLAAVFATAASLPSRAATLPDATPDLRPELFSSGQWVPGQIAVAQRQPDGKLLLGGSFNRVAGGIVRDHLLRLNQDGSIDMDFAPAFASSTAMEIRALAIAGDSIYVGGLFETVGGTPRNSIARLHRDGALDTGWNSPFAGTAANEVHAIVVTANGVFVGGDLLQNDAFGLVRLDPASGAIDLSWNAPTHYSPGSSSRGEVFAMTAVGGDLVVGGEFGEIAGIAKQGIARISQSAPVAVRAFDGGISGVVHALEARADRLYVGGDFFPAMGSSPNYLARLNATSGAIDTGFNPEPHGTVSALHVVVDALYVGGTFTAAVPGGARLARILLTGATAGMFDASFIPDASDEVRALSDTCRGRLIVGGNFVEVSGQTRNGLAGFAIPDIDCLFAGDFDGS